MLEPKVAGLTPVNFIKTETLAQVFSCEFCEIFKNNFSYGTHLVTTSVGISRKIESFLKETQIQTGAMSFTKAVAQTCSVKKVF